MSLFGDQRILVKLRRFSATMCGDVGAPLRRRRGCKAAPVLRLREARSEIRAQNMHPSDSLDSPDSIICFGIFELNLDTRELRKRGLQVKLTHQAFRLLEALVERSGEVLSREELRKRLWPANTYVDFEHSLNKAIHCLREVLGDSASNPRFIETIPGRGYRFVPVAQKQRDSQREKKHLTSVAVLPFTFSCSQHAESDFIAGQLTATLINVLSCESEVRVLAFHTLKHYERSGKSPSVIGAELGVKAVLIGEILQRNSEVLIHAELIDVRDGAQASGIQVKQSWPGFAEQIDKVAVEIARAMVPALAGGRTQKVRASRQSELRNRNPMPIGVRVLSKALVF